jgi:hypothetical protein
MKFRAWLALILFVHLLAHPLVHGLSLANKPAGHTAVSAPKTTPQTAHPIEDCALCRHSAALEKQPIALFDPEQSAARHIVPTQFAPVLFEFQQNVPARAPPIL